MLRFLGFVALIAIIFGISLGAALEGVIKFIVIGLGIIFAIGIIAKLLESEKGALFVSIASIIAVAYGIFLINDDYSIRYYACDSLSGYTPSYTTCLVNALDKHNDTVNRGWGYTIVGGITLLFSIGVPSEQSKQNKRDNNKQAKKH